MMQPPLFQQAITLPELESTLWEAANILPLLFPKRICDAWDEK